MRNCKCMLSVQVGWILSFLFHSGHVPYERKRSAKYLKNNACILFFFSSLFLIFSHSCLSPIVFPVTRNIFTILRCNTGQLVNIQRNHSELGTGTKLVSWANNCRPVRNVLMEYWVPIFFSFFFYCFAILIPVTLFVRCASRRVMHALVNSEPLGKQVATSGD